MKKLTGKIISVALVAALLAGCAGCGSTGGSSDSSDSSSSAGSSSSTASTESGEAASAVDFDSDPVTLTVFSELANYSGEQLGWSAKILKDKFNVILNIIPEQSGVYETRMESGDLGDIVIWGSDGENYTNALKAGLLYDWNADNLLSDYGSYIEENMSHALEKNSELTYTATDGESDAVYGFGHNVATSSEDHQAFLYTWDIRWDLYEQLGYPEVNDLDDLVDVLAQMKEICPTDENGNATYGASIWPDWDGSMVMYVKALATAYYGYDEFDIGLYDPDTGDFHDALEEDGPYLTCLKFFNKLHQMDLLDPNSMTQTYDEMYEKLQAGGVFWSIFDYAGSAGFNTDTHIAMDEYMCSLVPNDACPIVYGLNVLGGNRIWSIGANTEYPELCMEIINWFCTPEGFMTYLYGPEDLCWYYDDDGYSCLTDFGLTCHNDRSTPMDAEWGGSTFNDGCFQFNNTTWSEDAINLDSPVGEKYSCDYWKSMQSDACCDTEQDWRDYFNVSSVNEYMETTNYKVMPGSFTLATKDDDFKTVFNAVTDIIVTDSWRAIYADSDAEYDSIVAEMISDANSYGYADCVEWAIEQAAECYEYEQTIE
ncbi:MAG: hypothetical protein LUI02_06870 [Clostridiales bacterium]|nr:hypothetical protein [Clostridiales bacterium]